LETKNIKKTGTKFTENQNTATSRYSTAAFIHSKFSSLVSSGTVYSIKYTPKKKQIIK